MSSHEKYRKARKFYQDFPFLWAIEPICNFDLEIRACKLEVNVLSADVNKDTSWWAFIGYGGLMKEIREIPEREGSNLAAEIMAAMGILEKTATVFYLVSLERTPGFTKRIVIYRSRSVGLETISLLEDCRNISHSIDSISSS